MQHAPIDPENELLEKALDLAREAHRGQRDRYGAPYILHVLRVGLAGDTAEEIAAGILHDTVEDFYHSPEPLRRAGIPDRVIRLVEVLSRRDGEEYDEYIDRVLGSRTAMKIKLRDLADNMNVQRFPQGVAVDGERLQRYLRAWRRIRAAMEHEQ